MTQKILIAEDNEDLQEIYNIWLNTEFDIIQAYSGDEAVEKFKEYNPDLTLMDIKMPIMMGDRAIKHILEYNPKATIVAVTSYGYSESDLGVPVLRKGFNKSIFMKVVRTGIEGDPVLPQFFFS